MTAIYDAIKRKNGDCLNVYFTAGYPTLESTTEILTALNENGADLIELGLPYSDPLADGTTIQESSSIALKNGMKLDVLFDQLKSVKGKIQTPIILMGYYNQLLQYGVEKFLSIASESGVQAMIIPDLPMDVYEEKYQELFATYNIGMSFLITPETSDERIRQADKLSNAFIYMLSQTGITGKTGDIQQEQINYFDRINKMELKAPRLIGFGIHDKASYQMACTHSDGAIIGSAFIRALSKGEKIEETTKRFISSLRQ